MYVSLLDMSDILWRTVTFADCCLQASQSEALSRIHCVYVCVPSSVRN